MDYTVLAFAGLVAVFFYWKLRAPGSASSSPRGAQASGQSSTKERVSPPQTPEAKTQNNVAPLPKKPTAIPSGLKKRPELTRTATPLPGIQKKSTSIAGLSVAAKAGKKLTG